MLTPDWNAIQLETDVILLRRRPSAEGFMEAETNFALVHKMDVPGVPVALFTIDSLDENAITLENMFSITCGHEI